MAGLVPAIYAPPLHRLRRFAAWRPRGWPGQARHDGVVVRV